jgi:hypothetical protein
MLLDHLFQGEFCLCCLGKLDCNGLQPGSWDCQSVDATVSAHHVGTSIILSTLYLVLGPQMKSLSLPYVVA